MSYDRRMGPLEWQAVRDAQKKLGVPPGTPVKAGGWGRRSKVVLSRHDMGSAIHDPASSRIEQPKRGNMRNLFRRTPPVRRVSLEAFDHLPAAEAVRAAWLVPGPVPQYHRSMKLEVHARMPMLARALERLTKEGRS